MLPSLKGIFPQPKIQHRRNFLQENKLQLKELQKNSSRQQLAKKGHQLAQKVEIEQQKLSELRRRQQLRHKSLDAKSFPVAEKSNSVCSCNCVKSCETLHSVGSKKSLTCTREVQTDHILDEEFLYQSLRRCSSTNVQSVDNDSERIPQKDYNEPQIPDSVSEPELDLGNLAIDTDRNYEIPQTGSNTQLNSKKNTPKNAHVLGDRQDVRLPKYLEREKRDREEQKQKELQRDKNCPHGYEPLTDEKRKISLSMAQEKFQNLIGELNRMPMTTETLRTRTRKVEIERELIELEHDIRTFSQPKVYVKIDSVC